MKNLLMLIIAIIFIYGCARTVNTVTYYILDFPIEMRQDTEETVTTDVCEVLPVKIAEVYAQQRIALRKRSNEIIYYHYHQWAENPDENIGRLIQKKLSSDRLFDHISERVWNVSPRYQLFIGINNVEVIEGDDSLFAHINIDLDLFDKKRNKMAVIHSFDRSYGLEEWDLNDVALQMSSILRDELNTFSYKIRVYLISQLQK